MIEEEKLKAELYQEFYETHLGLWKRDRLEYQFQANKHVQSKLEEVRYRENNKNEDFKQAEREK